jgi:hypothetical protein
MTKLTPRSKRLLLLTLLLACVVPFAPLGNSQSRHLRQVEKHIARIAQEWDAFRRANAGFEKIHLFAYTGGDGMFGAYGGVRSDSDRERLRGFMAATKPPRPVFVDSIEVWDLEHAFKPGAEPDGAANRGQPRQPETNRESMAAGPGR